MVGSVSSSLKMRSPAAMAACRMLYLSLRSWMGRKKRCAYWMKAMRTPSVTVPKMPSGAMRLRCVEEAGVAQNGVAATPDDERDGGGAEELDDGIVERVGEDGVGPGLFVLGVDGGEVVEGAALAVEELHDRTCRRRTPA